MILVVVIALVINVFLALSLVFFRATRKTYPGFGLWTTGVSLLGLGYLFLCLRGYIPDSVSILVVNAAFPLGMVFQLAGMRLFLGLTPISRRWYALPGGAVAAAAVLYYGYDLEAWRTLIISIAISVPHFVMAFLILRQPVTPRSMFYGVIGSLLAMGGVVILGRAIWSLYEPQFNVFLNSPVQFIFFVSMVVLQLGENLAFIMLNSERVEGELVEAKTELIMTVNRLRDALTEQKRVEESLRVSEEAARSSESFLKSVIDQSPYPMWISDARGTLIKANKALCDLLRISDEEVVGKYNILRDNIVEEQGALPLMKSVFDKNETVRFEIKYDSSLLKHLQLMHSAFLILDVTAFPITDSGGKITNAVIQHIDITDRKLAEEALRQSEEKFRSLFENSLDGILLTAPDGKVFDANRSACHIFGWSEQGLHEIGRDGVVDRNDPRLPLALELRSRTGRFTGELNFKRKDGSIFPAEISSSIFRTANGDLRSTIVVRDITERKRADEALRASEEKYRLLVEKAQEAIFVVQDTVFRFVNPRLEEILGFSSGELIGNSFGAFVHPDDRNTVIENHYRRLKGEVFPSRYEIRIIDKQNRVKWAEIDSAVIDWKGKPAAMVFLTDTSYRKLAEEAAVRTERLKAIADLSGGVAHHFNNLLQIFMAGASLSLLDLESGDLTAIKTTLERILESAKQGSEMVNRLQTFANIRADFREEGAAIFDVAATARNAVQISRPLWKAEPEKKGIKVNLLLDLEEGCLIQGKENEVSEVLVSLIINAAEALAAGGDIEVKASKEAGEVVVRIRDTGIGIAEDDLPRVFQPFWSTRGVGIGKGMGLAVAHGLVKRHGGTISVQSAAGEGTTFTIRLPLALEAVTKTQQPPISTAKARLTILVVEDELHIATLLERILEKAGHRVFKTLSGKEGLAVFRKERSDLVICDLGMPGMNGWDVGKAIGTICRQKGITKPPFVLLTGWGGQELEKEKIAESGTEAVIAKPIDSAALLATIQEIAARFDSKANENEEPTPS